MLYEAPIVSPLHGMVVSDPSEVKHIIVNLLHLGLFEAMGKAYPIIHELDQTFKDKLGRR
jgi:hypothetical protein